jgi:4-amino-4-deoxy-L-arabinose transferase-like glycosyltransferase
MRMAETSNPRSLHPDTQAALLLAIGLTLVRVAALFRTPLNLYPDEAQYWLWSRTLDFGYYSKPPMIAWAIWATTHLGGDAEPWVRLSAPLFQGGAMLLVFALGRRLYGPAVGLAASALYALMPAVQLSAAVVATDAPLLFFLGLTLLAYVHLQQAQGRGARLAAAGFGAALGLAFLSKYAALYAVVGVGLHALLSREARAAWRPASIGLAVLAFAVVLSPNVVWNATHGFETLHHTASNANWDPAHLINPRELGEFLVTQFGVFGPIPMGVLIAGLVLAARRRRIEAADLMLLCFILPPLVIVSLQAFISRANANWSGASYLPGAVLVAAWLIRWRAKRWLTAAIVTQAVVVVAFLVFVLLPGVAEKAGVANSFKRAKGWDATSRLVLQRAAAEPGLSAIAVNNRFLYYALAYYGRTYFANPFNPPLKAWLVADHPQNQAEANAPLTIASGQRVLAVSYEGWFMPEMTADFAQTAGREIDSVSLDRKHQRKLQMFIGEGFAPRPRDSRTGRPTPP